MHIIGTSCQQINWQPHHACMMWRVAKFQVATKTRAINGPCPHWTTKLENLKKESVRYNINIMVVSEVKWKEAGKITTGKHTFVYSGGEVHER